jgi:hypothetical protein
LIHQTAFHSAIESYGAVGCHYVVNSREDRKYHLLLAFLNGANIDRN